MFCEFVIFLFLSQGFNSCLVSIFSKINHTNKPRFENNIKQQLIYKQRIAKAVISKYKMKINFGKINCKLI